MWDDLCSKISYLFEILPMSDDPFSDVLSILQPRVHVAGGFDLGKNWAIAFDAHAGIKCFALVTGRCWLAVEENGQPILLEAGDCVLLPSGRRFVMTSDPADPSQDPIRFAALPDLDWQNGIVTLNGGGDTMLLGGHFDFDGAHTAVLLGAMSPIGRLRDDDDKAGVRWVLDRLRRELIMARPGRTLVVRQLSHLLLVQALRLHIAQEGEHAAGWLFAFRDPKISKAVLAIHSDPGAPWTVTKLAETAGMSRSRFAERFSRITGSSPLDYVLRWRMLLAQDWLRHREPVPAIAARLGYASEAAFRTAFKRLTGVSPRRYAQGVLIFNQN